MAVLISLFVFFLVMFAALAARSLRLERTGKLYHLLGRAVQEIDPPAAAKPASLQRLERALLRAGVIMPVYRFLGYIAVSCGALFTLGLIITYRFTVAACLSFAGLGVAWLMLKRQSDKRREIFERQMEGIITVLSSGLRAGGSLAQSVTDLARELDDPGATEFAIAAREIAMGLPAAEALLRLAERMRSEDMQMLATAATVQSRSGGNLAELLDNLGDTVRDRKALRSSLKAYTAEGRLSGIVIGLIPFVVVGILLVINPAYFTPMFSSPAGRAVMIASFAMIFVGWFAIRRIMRKMIY